MILSVWCLFFRNKGRVKQHKVGPSHYNEWNFATARHHQQKKAEKTRCSENDEASAEQRQSSKVSGKGKNNSLQRKPISLLREGTWKKEKQLLVAMNH